MKNTASEAKAVTPSNGKTKAAPAQPADNASQTAQNITGRAVFAVDTSAAGIVVRTAFLTEEGQVIDMPAVFPDLTYALNQIDHLRQIVLDRFSQAAQVGVQVIAASAAQQATGATAPKTTDDPAASQDMPAVST